MGRILPGGEIIFIQEVNMNWKRVLSLVLVLVLIGTLFPGGGQARTRMVVRGATFDQALAAVKAVDGVVETELTALNTVIARVPVAKAALLNDIPGVVAMADRAVTGAALPEASGNNGAVDVEFSKTIGAAEVWQQGVLGQGVTVAILDTGIDPSMKGLKHGVNNNQRILAYYDAINDKFYSANKLNQSPKDPNGHGTHIAGIIANSVYETQDQEYQGVAPAVNLVAVRVLDETGAGTYASILRGLNWVVQNKDVYNIRVLNISMHSPAYTPYWADPFDLAVMKAWAAGIVVVASAGNAGPGPFSVGVPANTPYVITVGAFTDNNTPEDFSDDFIPPFSAAGPTMDGFVKPDVIAPGAHIISVMKNTSYLAGQYPERNLPGNYFRMTGTSTAAAVASGVVALMLSAHPNLTPDQVKYRLTMTASPHFNANNGATVYSMWQQGMGRIWAPKAVFSPIQGRANKGLDIEADLAGVMHFAGISYYDYAEGVFKISRYATGGYYTWDGTYRAPVWANLDGVPSWSDGVPSWSDGVPSWSDGVPSWSDFVNSWSDGVPSWSDGVPSWSDFVNSWSDVFPAWSDGVPSWSDGVPSWSDFVNSWSDFVNSWSDGVPSWSDYINAWLDFVNSWSDGVPSWSDFVNSWSDGVPSWSDGVPSWSDGVPSWSDGVPSWNDGVPSWSDGVPSWSDYAVFWSDYTLAWVDYVTSDGVPSWSDGVPSWSDGVPSWSDGVPSWSDGVPSWSDFVNSWSDYAVAWYDYASAWLDFVNSWSDGVPSWSDGVPSWSDGVPSWSDFVNSWSDGVPSWSDGVPSWSDGVPSWSDFVNSWSDFVNSWSDGVPSWSDFVNSWSDGVPSWSDGVPSWSDFVNSWSDFVNSWSDGVPSWSDVLNTWVDVWSGPEF